jgi:hypothetical protein
MNEKDIYAAMARTKLKEILAEPTYDEHGDCWCYQCLEKRAASHKENCGCNMCFELVDFYRRNPFINPPARPLSG